MVSPAALAGNRLLAALAKEVSPQLRAQLDNVVLPQGFVLHESNRGMQHAYFPTSALVSLTRLTEADRSMELAVVGRDGVVGVELLLGDGSTPHRAVVRVAGEALRVPSRTLQDEFNRPGVASELLRRYVMALAEQVAQTVVCARHHSVSQRLSRWLLMQLDHLPGYVVATTHEEVAGMLGVRREGVAESALRLQSLGLVCCERGHFFVLDRKGLESQACECYEVVKKEYARLLPETAAAASIPDPEGSGLRLPRQTSVPHPR